MRSAVIVVLLALAVSAHVVLADTCDDGECTSTVGINQKFATADCSGNSTLDTATNYTTPCETYVSGNYNQTNFYGCSSKSGFSRRVNDDSTSCAVLASTTFINTATGVCVQTGTSASQISWCNQASISNKFKAVKSYTNETLYQPFLGPCNATTGCTQGTGEIKLYAAKGCAGNVTGLYPASAIAGGILVPDVCYTSNGTSSDKRSSAFSKDFLTSGTFNNRQNVKVSCGNGRYRLDISTGGCGSSSNLIMSYSYPTDTCILLQGWATISCPSAASALTAGPLVFLLLIAFLFI